MGYFSRREVVLVVLYLVGNSRFNAVQYGLVVLELKVGSKKKTMCVLYCALMYSIV